MTLVLHECENRISFVLHQDNFLFFRLFMPGSIFRDGGVHPPGAGRGS